MRDFDILLLAILAERPLAWNGVVEALRHDGNLVVATGMVYVALRRLESQGVLQARWRTSNGDRRRRTYDLTESGRRILACCQGE